MKTLNFECTLLSDIILSEQAATEGTQKTLDYIPGNVFLGIVAGNIYKEIEQLPNPQKEAQLMDAMDLFHNAKVRFGDAYPCIDGKRAIKVPATWYVKKGETLKDQVYIYHKLPKPGLLVVNGKPQPIAQLRDKYIVKVKDNHFIDIKLGKNFAIKSAYNSDTRRSKDQQMYGYQSLEANMKLCFQVDLDDSVAVTYGSQILEILNGKHTIGRSKTAQYGEVEIVKVEEKDIKPNFGEYELLDRNKTFLYAESRLQYLDDYGQPFIPLKGEYYGIKGATVDLDQSQIRTFRYAPYNSKRQSRDADRFGIEKGSVICLNKEATGDEEKIIKNGIGLYLNEGYGKVLINPEFLRIAEVSDKAESYFEMMETQKEPEIVKHKSAEISIPETFKEKEVLSYLIRSLKAEEDKQSIYSKVEEFKKNNLYLFENSDERFASQWGTIRTKAMQLKTKEELNLALFRKVKNKEDAKNIKEGFLVSGQSATKWKDAQIRNLEFFLNNLEESIALKTMINLSAEMAKKCRKGTKQ